MPRSPPDNRLNRPNSRGFLSRFFLFSSAASSSSFSFVLASDAAEIAAASAGVATLCGVFGLGFGFGFGFGSGFGLGFGSGFGLGISGNKLTSSPCASAVRLAPA